MRQLYTLEVPRLNDPELQKTQQSVKEHFAKGNEPPLPTWETVLNLNEATNRANGKIVV